MIWLFAHSLPPSAVSKWSLFLSLPHVCRRSSLLTGEGRMGWARSQIIRPRESLAIYKSFNILWSNIFMWVYGLPYCRPKHNESRDNFLLQVCCAAYDIHCSRESYKLLFCLNGWSDITAVQRALCCRCPLFGLKISWYKWHKFHPDIKWFSCTNSQS